MQKENTFFFSAAIIFFSYILTNLRENELFAEKKVKFTGKHEWCSGIIQDSHSCDSGSIPGSCIFCGSWCVFWWHFQAGLPLLCLPFLFLAPALTFHVSMFLSHANDFNMCCQCFQLGCLATLCNFATEGLRMLDSVCLGTPADPTAC